MRCAVLGDPIAHSLSPVLHRAGYEAIGLDWSYDAVRVPSGGLGDFLATLDDSWVGLSLTMPLKREVLAYATSVSPWAREAGAANTVLVGRDRVEVDNTDLPGAAAAVRERYDGPVGTATILGGGATAASIGLALCRLGARSVTVLARDPDRAAEAVSTIRAHESGPQVTIGSLDDGRVEGDVVASTIPAAAQTPALVERCAGVPVVFEALYDPWPTPLAAAATASGRVLVGGLDLLVHQAALQFRMFTGRGVPVAVMRDAGEAALAARSRP